MSDPSLKDPNSRKMNRVEIAKIRQLRAMLALPTRTYITRKNRDLLSDCLDELLCLKDDSWSISETAKKEKEADTLAVPESATSALIDAEHNVSNATIDAAYRLLMAIYDGVKKRERLNCEVSSGGEDGTEDEICLGWGTIFCFIEEKTVQVCHTPIDGDSEDLTYTLDDTDSLQECASHVRRRMRMYRQWLDQQTTHNGK